MSTLLQRATAWLCLAIALVTGVAPGQGFTLCVQLATSSKVDTSATPDTCACCAADRADAPATPAVSHDCGPRCDACLDLLVPAFAKDARVQQKSVVFESAPLLMLAPCSPVQLSFAPDVVTTHRSRDAHPRPPASVALIRSVVLLV